MLDTVDEDLAGFPLLRGTPRAELADLARELRRRHVPAGTVLWRADDEADEMLWIVSGRVSISLPLPGDRAVELTTMGPGEVLGEVPLLDGGRRSATASVLEDATLLSLSRAGFAALVSRHHPTAFALKRRIAAGSAARMRRQLAALAATLARGAPPSARPEAVARLEPCPPPGEEYLQRLATARGFDPPALAAIRAAGRFVRCPAGRTLVAEGAAASAYHVVVNGAVEQAIVRGDERIRVSLAGPGGAFGYEGLIDGRPAAVTATARERSLLLVLDAEPFAALFHGNAPASQGFLDVVNRDLMAMLRRVLRPQARLAVGGPGSPRRGLTALRRRAA